MIRMRRKSVVLLLSSVLAINLVLGDSIRSLAQAQVRESVAVLDLVGEGISAFEADALSDQLRAEAFAIGKFEVMERERMMETLRGTEFGRLGACKTDQCGVEVGRIIGVDRVVMGKVTKVGRIFTVSLRMIDVKSRSVLRAVEEDFKYDIDRLLESIIGNLAREVMAEKKGGKAWLWGVIGVVVAGAAGAVIYSFMPGPAPEEELPPPPERP